MTTEPGDSAGPGARRIRVLWNANAGSKGGIPTNSTSEEQLRDLMRDHGLGNELVPTSSEDNARAAVQDAIRGGYDVVVAAGGDGSAGLIADELIGTEVALGILPLGSVMNVARSLGVPRDLAGAADVLAGGVVRTVDVGVVGERHFYEAGSVGMNAAIFREAQRFDAGDWGSILRTVWVALRYRPARMELRLDEGMVRTRALMVTISNGPYTGVAMMVAPDARLDDGLFDVTVFRGFSKWELIRHLVGIAFARRRYSPHVSTYRSSRVRATSAHPLPCRADSHDLGTTPVEFVVQPRALRVVVPAPRAPTEVS